MKKIIFPIVALAILLVPTVCVGATENADVNNNIITANNNTNNTVVYEINTYSGGKIILIISNVGNESVNYSFIVVYRMFRGIVLKNRSPMEISENGTVNANSTLNKTYDVKFSFSPIIAVLTVGNTSLVCTGFVFGKRVIFRAIAVVNTPII